jgi:cell division protein FtsI (penicillin-binding protein 3)
MSATGTPPRAPHRGPGQPGAGSQPRPPAAPSTWQRFRDGQLHFTRGNIDKRMRVLSLALVLVMGLFFFRLVYVQIIDTSAMAERAEETRLATTDLPAPRGTIYDVRGVALAQSVDARNIAVDQTLIEDPAATAAQLSPILGQPADKIQADLTGTKRFAYIARNITPEAAKQVIALQIPGIAEQKTLRRDYPGGSLGTSVLGFVNMEGHGAAGLEASLEPTLAGVDGRRSVEVIDGKVIPTATDEWQDPVPGTSVRLTIDRDLQYIAQEAIAKQVNASRAESGTVVVMEAKTGRILAMASVPTVDPTNYAKAKPEDLRNRAVEEAFEPGSTSKIMTMAAVINEDAANESTVFTVHDAIRRGTRIFKDHSPHDTFDLTLAGVLAKSSNTGSIAAAELIGEQKFYDYLGKFGVGRPTGSTFGAGEASGYAPPPSEWTDSTFPTLSFGQGLSVSALQMTSIFQTIANEGVRIEPRIVESTIDADGREVPADPPEAHEVVEPETATTVMHMMEGVLGDDGTAQNAAITGYRVAGKTGTANRIDDECGCYRGYTASFIGVAPADDPELIVGVFVQDPKGQYMGSDNGAPVFKEVMTSALTALGIPPTGADEHPLPVYADDLPPGKATAPVNPKETRAPFVSSPDTPQ